MGNINLYKSSSASGPWSLLKENIQSPVTFDEAAGGLVYYAVRDEGNGSNIEASEYKVISESVYVFGSADGVSNMTFDDATDLDGLIIKVTSTCGDTSNHKVQVQINIGDTGWKDLTQVEIGTDIQAKYTPTEEDALTEGTQIKFRAYIFNTTNTNYRTNDSDEYVYTLNLDSDIDVQFDTMDADYYYLLSTKTNISNVDTIDGIKFIDIQDNNIRLKDINYLSTQISNANIDWSFNITIYLSKIGFQTPIIKNIIIPNDLFYIAKNGRLITNYNMYIDDTLRNKGWSINYTTSRKKFRLAGSNTNSTLVNKATSDVCISIGSGVELIHIDKSKVIYYASLGDAYASCMTMEGSEDHCIDAITSSYIAPVVKEVNYDRLDVLLSISTRLNLSARVGVSGGYPPAKDYFCACYVIY